MATLKRTGRIGLESVSLRKLWTEWNSQACIAVDNDTCIDRLFKILLNRPWIRMLNRINRTPSIRWGKVLRIRGQIAMGTYAVDDLLSRAMDRLLEDISLLGK